MQSMVEGRERSSRFLSGRERRCAPPLHRTACGPPPLQKQGRTSGFTLIELLVALTIFALLAAAGVGLLSFSVKAQEVAGERLETLSQVRRAGALLTSDLAQAAPRVSRDEAGAPHPALLGSTGQGQPVLLSLVRRGWENLDDASRPSLQKVEYRLIGDRLERVAFRHVDGAVPLPAVPIATGVRTVRLRYRDADGQWRERWDPTNPSLLPLAVELVLDTEASGRTRQLFLVGTAL